MQAKHCTRFLPPPLVPFYPISITFVNNIRFRAISSMPIQKFLSQSTRGHINNTCDRTDETPGIFFRESAGRLISTVEAGLFWSASRKTLFFDPSMTIAGQKI
jgi:hypothetical protein